MADQSPKAELESKMAFVVGYTGETGKTLVKELLQRKVFKKLILIGRRQVKLDGDLYKDTEQRVVDFDNLDQHKAAFEDCQVGFCCLGTTSKAGREGMFKIDHDYVVGVAKAAHEQGCQHYSVVSAQNANKNSMFWYPKTKGLMEQHVAEIGLPRVTFFHPAMILCDREVRSIGYRIVFCAIKPIVWASPTLISVPVETLAQAMIADLSRKTTNKVDTIDNAAIHQLAKQV